MQQGIISLSVFKNTQFGWGIFTLSPVACITIDVKKLVRNLFHNGSALVGRESIKRKTRLSEYSPNITVASIQKHLAMHQSDFTLHCKYPTKNRWDQYKLVPEEVKKTTESPKQ